MNRQEGQAEGRAEGRPSVKIRNAQHQPTSPADTGYPCMPAMQPYGRRAPSGKRHTSWLNAHVRVQRCAARPPGAQGALFGPGLTGQVLVSFHKA